MKKFMYSSEAKTNVKPARTGFRVVVHDSISRFGVSDTRVTFYPGGRSVVTKTKGMCFIDLEPGTYHYIAKAPNFLQAEGEATVTPGEMKMVYIKLVRGEK